MTLCFATHNLNKLREIQQLLPAGIDLVGLDAAGITEEIPETADTIEGNSALKARYVFEKTGIPCFADDTGLEVDALEGRPGVYSARYAGESKDAHANMNLLLRELGETDARGAQFKTVITYIDAAGTAHQFTGIVRGQITREKHGSEGFGYDPVFCPDGHEVTFAEMSAAAKNQISHRGRAFTQLVQFLQKTPQ